MKSPSWRITRGEYLLIALFGHIRSRHKDDIIEDDLCAFSLDALGCFPHVGFQVALDVDWLALFHILAAKLGQAAPAHDVVEFGERLLLAVRVLPHAIGRETELAEMFTAGGTPCIGVAYDLAEKDHFVDGLHKDWGK